MSQHNPPSLPDAISEFIGAFEVVFHYDWEYTTEMLDPDLPSFLATGMDAEEETDNWGARGALLEKYRNLVVAMKAAGLAPKFPFPLENLPNRAERLW